MPGSLMNVIRKLRSFRYRRSIERALALHLRGEVRDDGLKLKNVNTRLEIEWHARDVHPWDRLDPPARRSAHFVRQSLNDTEAAITRLFRALPEVDDIALTVLEQNSAKVILAGTVHRPTAERASDLSVGMRLWERGVMYHSDGFQFEPLRSSDDQDASIAEGSQEEIPVFH